VTDPLVEAAGSTTRCWRGGSWNYHEATLQSSIRFFDEEDRGNDHFGFRITGANTTTSVEEIKKHPRFNIYPNPTYDYITIEILSNQKQSIRIYSASGRLLLSKETSGELLIDVSAWSRGIYFISLNGESKRLIVE